jgi:alpha-galactosidase
MSKMRKRLRVLSLLLLGFGLNLVDLAQAAETVWLSDLDLSKVRQDTGQPFKVTAEKPVSVAGHRFEQGLATHATSLLWIELGGQIEEFSAQVGVLDGPKNRAGSVGFAIMTDGRWVWNSGVIRFGQEARPVQLDLHGVRWLLLRVDNGADNTSGDAAVWANAQFVTRGKKPAAFEPVPEKAEILTPKPPRTPRINGAKVFGVRPGSPFLFTIPATGQRPMWFSVEPLPPGLQVNAENGQITGTLAATNTWVVTLQASNALGVARRPFKIVCGDTLALTPPMGWNSWYVWRRKVSDQIMREAADAMVSSGLINHGYMYVNIDDCWAMKKPADAAGTSTNRTRDAQGRIQPNERFPNMKALTDYIHAKGLKAGIYTSPGPNTCAACEGAFEHEALDLATFADWGFDFLKHDWCSYHKISSGVDPVEAQKPFALVAGLLRQLPRDIILNFNAPKLPRTPGAAPWRWGRQAGAQSWRTSDDLGATYYGIATGIYRDVLDFYTQEHLEQFAGPGGWNDPDYLLMGCIGNGRGDLVPTSLTPNEQYTQFSIWCLVAAPLILSGDITRFDDFALNVLGNDEVIAVDQDPLGKPAHRLSLQGEAEVWARPLEDGGWAVGLFNRGGVETTVTLNWSDLGLAGGQTVRDLWRQRDLGTFAEHFQSKVPSDGVLLVKLSKAPGR